MIKKIIAWFRRPRQMSFLFADDFLNMLLVYRALWIQGRYGGGKTSLAVILAAWLLQNNHVGRVVSNCACVLDTLIEVKDGKIQELLYDAALLIDETHAFIADRASVGVYAKFLRKTNYFLLMPSVMPPHVRLTGFAVQRVFNGYVYGLPIWVYQWNLRSGNIREKGYFAILHPSAVFGAYDTKHIPIDDANISDAIDLTIEFEQWQGMTRLDRAKCLPGTALEGDDLKKYFLDMKAAGVNLIKTATKKATGKNVKATMDKGQNQDLQDVLEDVAEEVARSTQDLDSAVKKIRRARR